MADANESRGKGLGGFPPRDRPEPAGVAGPALLAGLAWLVLAGAALAAGGIGMGDGTGAPVLLLALLALVLPLGLIWVGALTVRSGRIIRAEAARLDAAVEALRRAHQQSGRDGGADSGAAIAKKLDEIAATQKKTETALAMFTSTRAREGLGRRAGGSGGAGAPQGPEGPDADQPDLALGTPAEVFVQSLPNGDFIRALNFPDTAEDEVGFAALRRALKHRPAAQLIQASQDVLTLLSQDGIYMDDLRPDMARPELWRRFAQGERGRPTAALGGVRDRASLALTSTRMKEDPIFRDAAHHFLRLFDKGLARFEPEASDTEITAFADTRSARAFMLVGRVAGTFD
ncbi:hypothetical protein [Roseivivax sp.]